MKKLLIGTAALALGFASAPASAQLLGGGGGGGVLGGPLGGGLGSPLGRLPQQTLPDRMDRTLDASGQARTSTKAQRTIDPRSGTVSASRSGDASLTGVLSSTGTNAAGDPVTRSAAGSASGSGSGSVDAQFVGTDAVRSTTGTARDRATTAAAAVRDRATTTAGTARDTATTTAGSAKDRAASAIGTARDRAGSLTQNAGAVAGSAAGSANGMASGSNGSANGTGNASGNAGLGTLALAGSGAASGQGMFPVAPGMAVTDQKGRAIGTVQSLASDSRGRIQAVKMKIGNRLATLPASNFSGDGDVLVSAMGKSEVKRAAKDGQAAPASNPQNDAAAPTASNSKNGQGSEQY